MSYRKSTPCSLCGAPVNRAAGLRKGLTAEHWPEVKVVGGVRRVRCDGSDLAYAAHRYRQEIREVPPSPFRKVIARLRGHSVTHVDFLEARVQRAQGKIKERSDVRKFIRREVRDV